MLLIGKPKVREYRGDGHWTTTTYYDHYLDCADPTVQTVTALHSPSAEVGEVLTVVYDSQRRAPAQFAREVGEPRTWFELCAICAGLAFMLRAAAEVVTREQDDTATAVVGALVFDLAVLLNGLLFLALLVAALRSAGWFTATVLDLFGVGGASYGWAFSILTAAVLVALAAYLSLVRGHRLLGRLLAAIPSLSWDDRVSRELLVESFDSWMIRAAEHTVKRWFSRSYAKSAS